MAAEIITRVDGRAARGERSRVAVATALLDLLEEGVVEPTAGQIAARAKVSERLVFHHFADLEVLHATAAKLQMERILPMIKPVDPTLPFAQRIEAFVANRARFFERLSPARRAAIRREPFSQEIARGLKTANELARNLACSIFGSELALLTQGEAVEVSSALSAATSWENWDYLRRREGLSIPKASKVVERTIRALFRIDDRVGFDRGVVSNRFN